MAKPCSIKEMKQSLTVSGGKKFKITTFCETVNMDRGSFYHQYKGGRQDLFASVVKTEINKHFVAKLGSREYRTERIFDSFLIEAEKKCELYRWMFNSLTQEELVYVRHQLLKCLFENFKDYTFERRGISKTRLKAIVNGIYSRVFEWILTGCQDEKNEVFFTLNIYTPMLEGHRCTFSA